MRDSKRGLRLIWTSNAPWVPTGYGVQAQHILPALKSMPEVEDIKVLAFYGLQGGRIKYRMAGRDWDILPITSDIYGNTAISSYALEFKSDVVISLLDIWVLDKEYGRGFMWCPYMPIDMEPLPVAFTSRLQHAYLPLVYSKYASRVFDGLGIEHMYVPHGVDTTVYKPMVKWKRASRKALGFPEETWSSYIFGMVAANKGLPARKAFPEVFEAFSRVVDAGVDAYLYLHTLVTTTAGGPDLQVMARVFGIEDRIVYSNEHLLLSGAYKSADMARVYNSMDCLLSPSYSEGFGIPIIEAQACGVPVIACDSFAMTELAQVGWLVPWDHKLYHQLGANMYMPSVDALTSAMLEAVKVGRKQLAQDATNAMRVYDWQYVIDTYWKPVIRRLHDELVPRTYSISSVAPATSVNGSANSSANHEVRELEHSSLRN